MNVATALAKISYAPYPAANVAAVLQQELIDAVRGNAERKGAAVPFSDAELAELSTFIDSLAVVELLCAVDDVLPFEVGECVVRAGGYNSVAAAVKHLVGRIETQWIRYHTGVKV